MKQCPRCKSQLTKSHSEKLICRACGFITQKLQVARQNQQFQQTYNYSKRISLIKSGSQPQEQVSQQQQLRNHYVMSFQNALKTAANSLSKIKLEYRKIQYHLRFVWLAYVHKAAQLEIDISGIYGKSNSKADKKNNNRKGKAEQSQDDGNGNAKIVDEGRQKQEQDEHENKVENVKNKAKQQQVVEDQWKPIKKPRGRPPRSKPISKKYELIPEAQSTHEQKKPPFSTAIRHKLLILHQNQDQLQPCLQRRSFLEFVYRTTQSQCRQLQQQSTQKIRRQTQKLKQTKTKIQKNRKISKTLQYIALKYAELLIKQLNSYNLNLCSNVSQAKGKTKRVSNKQLQQLITMRKLDFKDRNQIMLVLLLDDLLKQWSNQMQFQQSSSLQDLLIIYSSQKNTNPKPIITATINNLKQLISQQSTLASQSQSKHNNFTFPTLSLTLMYSFMYISCLLNSSTMSIDDVVLSCGRVGLMSRDWNRCDFGRGKICNNQIRKTAATVLRVLGLDLAVTNSGLVNWVLKYAHACGIQNQDRQLTKLTQTLYNSHQLTTSSQHHSRRRYEFLEQDIIAKSILIVHVKLSCGFRTYPYLSTFPVELITRMQRMKTASNVTNEELEKLDKYIKLLRRLDAIREQDSVSLSKCVSKLQEEYGIGSKRYRQLCTHYTVGSYCSLQGLTSKQLTALIDSSTVKHTSFSFSINLAYNYTPKQQYPMVYIASSSALNNHNSNGIQQRTLSKTMENQIKIVINELQDQYTNDHKSSDEKLASIYRQLDAPASNYQFFYDYINNIKHAGRDLFVHFVQVLAARECKVKHVYGWLQKMERVLVQFQN